MDPTRFVALVRTLATAAPRRRALLGLLAGLAAPLGLGPGGVVEPERGKGRGRGRGQRRDKRAGAGKRGKGRAGRARAEQLPGRCCSTGDCTPGPGKNLQKCCYEGRDLAGANFKGSNLGGANFSGATLVNADFRSANLDKACLVGADLTGANLAGASAGTATFCRTRMPDGTTINDSGCGRGTECCPTCDPAHPCPAGQVCCGGRCRAGTCCAAADCPDRECQGKACQNRQCVYTAQADGQLGTLCAAPRQCCGGACCPDGQQCCAGACTSDPSCCLPPGAACTQDAQCCAQVCLDNGFCGCFSQTTGEIPCPSGCECHQANPGSVGACMEAIDVTPCCDSLPECNSNRDCGLTSFCDESVCGGGVCVRRCPSP